jgi:hypothetical protein
VSDVGTNTGVFMLARKKDESVFKMLQAEQERCAQVVEKIRGEIEKLPKGSLGQRKVKSADNEYIYPCLRYRKGSSVIFEHLSAEKAEELKPLLDKRKKLISDLKTIKRRIVTLNSILQKG